MSDTDTTATNDVRSVVLNVGCGPKGAVRIGEYFPSAAWRELRLDIDPAVAPDIVASITNMNTVPDASMDAIWSSHNLEHLYFHEVTQALCECLRVLKPGGILVALVPDLQKVSKLIAEDRFHEELYNSAAGPITVHDMVYGHTAAIAAGQIHMAHRTGFTPTVLGKCLVDAGFLPVTLKRTPHHELLAMAHRPVADPTGVHGA